MSSWSIGVPTAWGVLSAIAIECMLRGLQGYRHDMQVFAPNTTRLNCFEYDTQLVLPKGGWLLGERLLPVGPVGDPWFHNHWMTGYTSICYFILGSGFLYILHLWPKLSPGSNKQQRFQVQTYRLVASWMFSLVLVAYVFAPLPVCRLVTFCGVAHNIIEWRLVHHLGFVGSRWQSFGYFFTRTWILAEFAGGMLLGDVYHQWITFFVMGACVDAAVLAAAAVRLYRRPSPSNMALLCAVFVHFMYVVLFFVHARCSFFPPMAKVVGLYLNSTCMWLAAYALHLLVHQPKPMA